MLKIVMIAVAATALTLPTQAQKYDNDVSNDALIGHEVDVSLEITQNRLAARGYTLVTVLGGDPLWLSAFDPQGHAVLLRVNPQTGLISSSSDIDATGG